MPLITARRIPVSRFGWGPFLHPGLHHSGAPCAAAVEDGRRPTPKAARSVLCAGHVQQPGGESPLCNLMEVKHE